MDILKTVRKTVCRYNMLKPGDSVLVGLSGGADSTALLYLLLSLKQEFDLKIACAHINHGLRETADRDMLFCKALCEKMGVELFLLKRDIKTRAKEAGMSEELYARGVRYDFFASLGFDKIATAHNKNDVAETLLFNFMRGASLKGLSGIPYVRDNIIRPLLDVKKTDIVAFCKKNGYDFVTDETNFQEIYTRNKIRLDLIPKIETEFNPAFVDVATKNAELIREDAEFLDRLAEKEFSGEVTLSELCGMEIPIKRRVLELLWKKSTEAAENLGSDYIDSIIELCRKNHTGKKIDLPGGFCAKTEYGRIIIEKNEKIAGYSYEIYPDTVLNIPEIGKTVLIRRTEDKPDFYLDEDAVLTVRSRLSGDVFYPCKMTGKKKLSDFFTDKKMTQEQRDKTPVLLCCGEIVAVGDLRFSRNFQDKNKTGYKIEIKEK